MEEESRLNDFIKAPQKSLISLSMPVIAASVVETLYNVVDAIYVGRLGSDALAAITFAWPFFFFLVALSLGINSGIASRVSRFIGEKNKKQAENTALHGLLLAGVASVAIAAITLPLLRPIFRLSGAEGPALEMAVAYIQVILAGILFMFLSYAANSIFSSQGDTKTAMKIDIYSLVLNIILAPIFVFYLKMGIRGAALATSLSVAFAFIQSIYYIRKKSYLHLNLKSFRFSWPIIKEIVVVGIPSSLMLLVISFYTLFLNRAMVHFSTDHVAAFGIVSRLEGVAILPVYGLSVGAMTLAGMFYGAKKYKLLKGISWYAIGISSILTSIIGIILFIFPRYPLMLFTTDPTVLSLAVAYLRFDVFTFPLMAITMLTSRITQALGLGLPGLVVNIVRVLGVAVPLAYVFVFILHMGFLSIAVAMILGGVAASAVGLIWLAVILRRVHNRK